MTKTLQPEVITTEEISAKLDLLGNVLHERKYNSILLVSEGSMRWLTGIKHQLGDVAPSAVSPVNAFIEFNGNNKKISIISKSFEIPRLKSEITEIFGDVPNLEYDFSKLIPICEKNQLVPEDDNYQTVLDLAIRPLLGGVIGNQYKKLNWLSNMTMKVLVETAEQLAPAMNGMEVQGKLAYNLGKYGIDSNLRLIALAGQNDFLHPIASSHYQVEEDKWLKLVVGSRYAEHIVSQSLLVKLGGKISEEERTIYHALQDAAIEYADCYRAGAVEHDIYQKMIEHFKSIETKYKLKDFAESATLHHPGGGTSPLGNRDKMLNPKKRS